MPRHEWRHGVTFPESALDRNRPWPRKNAGAVKVDRQVFKIEIGHFSPTFRNFLSFTMLKGHFLDLIEFENGLLMLIPGKSRI